MHKTAYALLLLAAFSWGGNAVAGKMAVGHLSPMLLTTLRWGVAAAILVPFAWGPLKKDWPVVRRHLPLLAGLGALGFTCFNATLYSALNFTSAINVSIEQAGMPMVIFLLNFLLFRLRVTWLQLAGFILSVVGITVAVSHGDLSRLLGLDVNFGDALMILAVLLYSGYTVALRFKPDIHWLSTITVLAVAAFVASLPFTAWEYASGRLVLPDTQGLLVAAYAALIPSILAQLFYIRGNELIGGNRAGLFINLVPIFGTLLSILILGEAFQAYHAFAIVLVFLGIGLAEYSGRKLGEPVPRVRAPVRGS